MYWNYIFIAILIALSAFFSGTEIAYTSLNKLRLKKEAENGGVLLKAVSYIYDHYQPALSTILIGNNLVNIAATSVATVITLDLCMKFSLNENTGTTLVTLIMTILILLFGEITPKIIGTNLCEKVAKISAYPLLVLMVLFYPVVLISTGITKLFSLLWRSSDEDENVTITEEELVNILETVEDEGVIDEETTDLLQSALEFSDLAAEDILTPRIDVVAIEIHDSMENILNTIMDTRFSRIPVYERTIDHIVGIIHVNTLYKALVDKPDVSLSEMLMEPVYIPQSMKLPAILSKLRERQTHIAIVTDEYGGTMGLLTMEDVLEQLVGEIWDENDEIVNEFVKISEYRYECSGQMNINDFIDEMELDDIDTKSTTVGGWAAEELGEMPQTFDAFDFRNLTVIVKETENNRVTRLIVLVYQDQEEEE